MRFHRQGEASAWLRDGRRRRRRWRHVRAPRFEYEHDDEPEDNKEEEEYTLPPPRVLLVPRRFR